MIDPIDRDHWVTLATYATMFEAEHARAILDDANIPAMLKSHGMAGVFGPGYSGPVPGGVVLLVSAREVDRAWSLVIRL